MKNFYQKKRKSFLLLILTASLLFSACGNSAPTPAGDAPSTAPSSAPQQEGSVAAPPADGPIQRGGTLNAAVAAKWTSLDPTTSSARAGDKFMLNQMYETLIQLDSSGEFVPGLADSWDVSDPTTVVLKLKEGVKFHDGTDFNAEAVKFVIERGLDPENRATYRSEINDIESVEVVDSHTVKINLQSPSAVILGALSNYAGYMISPTAIEKYGEDIVRNPVGTGPFQLKEAVDGDHILLEKNPSYHIMGEDGQPLPYLDQINISIIADDSVKLVNLKSGAVSLVDSMQTMNIQSLESTGEFTAVRTSAGKAFKLMINVNEEGPLSKPEVRQAIAYALNREAFVKVVCDGYGTVEPWNITKEQWFYDGNSPYTYDPAKSKELLAAAGYPDGFSTNLLVTSREPDKTIIQLVQAQLKEVGITGEIEALEKLAFNDKWKNGEASIGQNFASIPKPDPYMQFEQFFGENGNNNFTGYADPEFNKALAELRVTFDTAKRKELVSQAQACILRDSPEIFMFHSPTYQAISNKLQGFVVDPEGGWLLGTSWLAS